MAAGEIMAGGVSGEAESEKKAEIEGLEIRQTAYQVGGWRRSNGWLSAAWHGVACG